MTTSALRWLLILTAVVTPASVDAQSNGTPPPLPAPGRLVDVGGWRLHLYCTGETRLGQPTVVLEAGQGDFSVEWSLLQPELARSARVCSYDRAGDGWSELGPHPRTFSQIVYELHILLREGGEKGPFVLVGHSYGSWLVRAYQTRYPEDVAGLVLLESGGTDPWRMMGDGRLTRSSALARGRPVPAAKTAGPLRISDIPPAALAQMSAGLTAASAAANRPPRDKLPVDAQRMRTWALGQIGHVAAAVNPFEHDELALLRAQAERNEYPLGDLPLVVVTRGLPDEEGPEAERLEAEHRRDQASMSRWSRRGVHIFAGNSRHHVQLDEPDLVVRTILDMLAATRR